MSPDTLPFQFVQTELRSNLLFFGIASIVLAAGVSSLLLAALRSRDRLLFWLGTFSVLYASRLFIQNGLVHTAIGAGDRQILPWILCLTYLIPIPFASFGRELLGSGWKKNRYRSGFGFKLPLLSLPIPTLVFSHQRARLGPISLTASLLSAELSSSYFTLFSGARIRRHCQGPLRGLLSSAASWSC